MLKGLENVEIYIDSSICFVEIYIDSTSCFVEIYIDPGPSISTAGSFATASPGPIAQAAVTTSWSLFPARAATSVRLARPATWSRRPPTWLTMSCPGSRSGSGCSRCRNGSGGTCATSRKLSAAGATLQLLPEARDKMGLPDAEMPSAAVGPAADDGPKSVLRRAAAHCWALLLVRIYECLPLRCRHCVS